MFSLEVLLYAYVLLPLIYLGILFCKNFYDSRDTKFYAPLSYPFARETFMKSLSETPVIYAFVPIAFATPLFFLALLVGAVVLIGVIGTIIQIIWRSGSKYFKFSIADAVEMFKKEK